MDLRTKRRKLGLTQVKLAEQAECKQPMIAALEAGKYFPRNVTQRKIEAIIGPVDWIETRLPNGFKIKDIKNINSDDTKKIMNQIAIYIMRNQTSDRVTKFKLLHRYLNKLEKHLHNENENISYMQEELFPVYFNGKKYNKKDCGDIFLQFYFTKDALNGDGGVYLSDGMWVYPDDSMDEY